LSTFYCLYNSTSPDSLNLSDRVELLAAACQKLNIVFYALDESTVDFSNLPTPTKNDGLYNCGRGSYLLESVLLNSEVKHFYRSVPFLSQKDDSNQLAVQLEKSGIPVPKTIYKGTNNKLLLKKYVEYLDGFPIILKTHGGTGGVGVIKINDFDTLLSMSDYLHSQNCNFQLKQFIPSASCERLCVLGDSVLYSLTRPIKEQDFRNEIAKTGNQFLIFPKEIQEVAIKAAHSANYNYAGVDLIIDKRNNLPYILEVNCPQNFAIHQKIIQIDFAFHMLKWLFKI